MSSSATRISYRNGYIPGQYINGIQHANGVQYANEEYANREAASLTTHHLLSLSAPIGRRRFDTLPSSTTTLHPSTLSLCCWLEHPRSFEVR